MNLTTIKQAKTKYLGKQIEYYPELSSTHLWAKELIRKEKLEQGKIILADQQTQGIGTKGRQWYTGKAKNIAMTIILKPHCSLASLEGLTVTIAETMKQTIQELYAYPLTRKEPNDLLLNEKKISGILTEVHTSAGELHDLLISIGFNVNEEYFSEETKNIATSLKQEYHQEFSREEIIVRFLEILEQQLKKAMIIE